MHCPNVRLHSAAKLGLLSINPLTLQGSETLGDLRVGESSAV